LGVHPQPPRLINTTMTDLSFSAPKLEPFLLMAKSTKGAAAAKLIENATAAAGVYVFAELLDLPNIEEVRLPFLIFCYLSIRGNM
jgi:hypothetical protein